MQRILLVDDDQDDQLYFRDAMNEIRPSVRFDVANNGVEALLQVGVPPPPDLIFMDLNMPVMDGYECLVELKKKPGYKDIPVVIFTTSKNVRDIERAQKLGASLFFTKPTDFEMLCSKLSDILGLDFSNLAFHSLN
jgi:CheY-like chemotaxis protein